MIEPWIIVQECYYKKTSLLCFSGSDEYGWWFSAEDDTYDPLSPSDISKGYYESIELVRSTFDNQVIMHRYCMFCTKFLTD